PNHMVEQMVVAAEAVLEQDGVVLRGVEHAVGDIRHPEFRDDSAALELQVAELRHLVWRLTRPVREGDGRPGEEGGDQGGAKPQTCSTPYPPARPLVGASGDGTVAKRGLRPASVNGPPHHAPSPGVRVARVVFSRGSRLMPVRGGVMPSALASTRSGTAS